MRLILNSRGLNTEQGTMLIHKKIAGERLYSKTIFCVVYPRYEAANECIMHNLLRMGFRKENIYMSTDGLPRENNGTIKTVDYVYVTEGNTFHILEFMRDQHLTDYIQSLSFNRTFTYIGSSAGAIISSASTEFAKDFDDDWENIKDFRGLGLFDGTIVPHYGVRELKRYRASKWKEDRKLVRSFRHIYCVPNDEVLVIDDVNNLPDDNGLWKRNKNEIVIIERNYFLTLNHNAYTRIYDGQKTIVFGVLNSLIDEIPFGNKLILSDKDQNSKNYMIAILKGLYPIYDLSDMKDIISDKVLQDNEIPAQGLPVRDIIKYEGCRGRKTNGMPYVALQIELKYRSE